MTNQDELFKILDEALPHEKISRDYYSSSVIITTSVLHYSNFIDVKLIISTDCYDNFVIKVDSEDSIVRKATSEKQLIKILKTLV